MSFFGPPIRNGVPIGLGSSIGFGSAPFTPAELFYAGEQGFWYDPTDIPLAWRRNLLQYTEDFSNAYWAKARGTITANSGVAPDGTSTADLLTATATGTYATAYRTPVSYVGSQAYTLSVYAKADVGQFLIMYVGESSATGRANFDLSTGTVGTVSGGASASMINVGNGWYRCIVTATPAATTSEVVVIGVVDGNTVATVTSGKAILIWGAQLELGSTASTYQQIVTPEISFLQYQSQPVLYQDSAGTTPVTAAEQPVGLMLDKSKGGRQALPITGWAQVSGDGVVTVNGGTITITGATTTTRVDIAAPVWAIGNYADITINGTVSGAVSPFLFIGGSAIPIVAGTNTYRSLILSSNLCRVQITSGSATFDVTSRGIVPGNHAFQTTSAKRPVLRARYNLLTYSEAFSNAAWSNVQTVVTLNAGTAPNGTNTANKLTPNTVNAGHAIYPAGAGIAISSGVQYTGSVYVKAAGYNFAFIATNVRGGYGISVCIDLTTGAQSNAGANGTYTVTNVGDGWWRVTGTGPSTTTSGYLEIWPRDTAGTGTSFAGNGTDGILAWGADLRPASQATGLIGPTYQRIAAATDYDVVGFLPYLQFDGFDDAMTTNSIDFSATDKMTVWAGVRKLSDATDGMVAELSAVAGTNNGAFLMAFPGNITVVGPNMVLGLRGTQAAYSDARTYTAPLTGVLQASFDIAQATAANEIQQRVNGAVPTTITYLGADAGTGNFGNYPLFIGARNQTSLYFNGWLSSLIGRGASTTAGQISATEQWVNTKTGAY